MRAATLPAIARPAVGRQALTALVFLLGTLVVTLRAAEGQLLLALALVGGAVLAVVLPRPRLLLALLLGLVYLTSFVGGLPTIEVAGIRSDPAELLTMAAVGWALLQVVTGHSANERPVFATPLLVLTVAFIVAAVVGLQRGADTGALVAQAKMLPVYLLPLALVTMLRDRSDVDFFERCLLAVATMASALTLVAAVLPGLLTVRTSTEVISLTERSEAQRLIPPAVYLVFVAFLFLVHQLASRGVTPWRCTQAGLFVFTLGVSFFRSLWAPLILCTIAYVVLHRGPRVPLRGTATALVIAAALLAYVPLASSGALGATSAALVERARSAFSSEVTDENSFRDRANENAAAWQSLRESPVVGVGLGTSYGISRRVYTTDENGNKSFTRDERYFIHNTYLGVLIRFGLLGAAAFVLLGVRVVRECVLAQVRRGTEDASRALAAALALLGVLLMSSLQTSLFQTPTVLAAGCALVLLHGSARAPEPPEHTEATAR